MNGFYLAIGKQGRGKTLFITRLMVDNLNGRKLFSNYTIYGIPYERITFDNDKEVEKGAIDILDQLDSNPDFFNNSIMLLDEIHVYFDSLDFMKNNKRRVHTFFSQLRKRNILLLGTTQYLLNLDVRIRRQCMNVFQMDLHPDIKGVFNVEVHDIDGYYSKYIKDFDIDLRDYFKYYDTNEIVN